jgi:hypothetical protein
MATPDPIAASRGAPADRPRSAFYRHLLEHGTMTRKNKELQRIHRATGLSADHLFKIATGKRTPSRAAAKVIVEAVRRSNPAVTVESFGLN